MPLKGRTRKSVTTQVFLQIPPMNNSIKYISVPTATPGRFVSFYMRIHSSKNTPRAACFSGDLQKSQTQIVRHFFFRDIREWFWLQRFSNMIDSRLEREASSFPSVTAEENLIAKSECHTTQLYA